MINWLLQNLVGIVGIIMGGFIAYHIYFLSKQSKLEHKEKIKRKAEELTLGKEIYLVNLKRYFRDYPSNTEKLFSGYSHIKAEFKTTRFDGIEFFCGIKEVPKDGKNIKVFEVGIVPYEWIDYVDLRGDEHGYKPLFFCRFKGKRYWKMSPKRLLPFGYPYKEILYYKESEVYHEGSDPVDMKYQWVDFK